MTGPIHHRVAKRWVRTAQIAMLVGAVGVIPVLMFGMPPAAPVVVDDLKPTEPKRDPNAPEKSAKGVGMDASGIGARFELVSNNPKPKPSAEEQEAGKVPPPPPPPAMRFLGAVIEPASRAALVVVDNKQRMLWVGDKTGSVELVEIEPDHITIKEHGVERRLELSPRSGPVVTASANGNGNGPMTNGAAPPGGDISGAADTPEGREMRSREMLDRIRTRPDGRPR